MAAPMASPEAQAIAAESPAQPAVSDPPKERMLPIRHTGPQLNRNDVCPMGTGKKFKNCCGADGNTKFCTGAGLGK